MPTIRVRCNRTLFLAHAGCGDITVILKGTTGRLVKSWGLRDDISGIVSGIGDDGFEPVPDRKTKQIYPVIEWDAALWIDADPDRDTDGEYESEGSVRLKQETNQGIPWDAIEFISVEEP